jgi:hypothetical protein
MEKMKTGSFASKGLIIGGIIILASVYDVGGAQTILPWYVKVAGGIGLIIIGIFQIQKRNKGD